MDWRIRLGLGLTGVWLALGFVYIAGVVGFEEFGTLPAADIGSFFEGAFAPLAFLWLVIGYFLQQQELEQNTRALKSQAEEIQRTAEQAIIQSEKMAANEMHARQDAFLSISDSVNHQLGLIAGFLYLSSHTAAEGGRVTSDEIGAMFTALSRSDHEVFSRQLMSAHVEAAAEDRYDLFYGTEIRARHSNHFVWVFERLLKRGEEVDIDGLLRDALVANTHGLIYGLAKRHQAEAPPELANVEVTGRHLQL